MLRFPENHIAPSGPAAIPLSPLKRHRILGDLRAQRREANDDKQSAAQAVPQTSRKNLVADW
jgi:hypothetical protein